MGYAASTFQLVVSAKHRLKNVSKPVMLSALVSDRFVLNRAKRHRQTLDEYFEGKGFKPTIVAEASTVADVLSLVREGEELATIVALPTPHLINRDRLVVIPMGDAPLQRSFLIWPAPDIRNKAAKVYEDALKKCFRRPGA